RHTFHDVPCQGGREVDAALQDLTNGLEQLVAGRLLEQETGGPSAPGEGRQIRIVVHRQHDDLAVDAFGSQTGQYVEATEPRHGEVRDDHVGENPCRAPDEPLPAPTR